MSVIPVVPPRAAHVLQRAPGRRALLTAPGPDTGRERPATAAPRWPGPSGPARHDAPNRQDPGSGQQWYRAREVDPDSPDDVASLALLRWWSRAGAERLEPGEFPAFLAQFARWWGQHPDYQLAVLVEEVGPDAAAPVPVAMGWVVARADLASDVPATSHLPAVSHGVFVLPGTPGTRIRRDLAAAMGRLAASRGMHLTPLPPRP